MPTSRFTKFALASAVALVALVASVRAQQTRVTGTVAEYAPGGIALVPTNHPVVPRDLSQLWLVPPVVSPAPLALVQAMQLQAKGEYTRALAIFSRAASQDGVAGLYATYDMAATLLNLGQSEQARKAFRSIADRHPIGYLAEAAAFGEAQSAETMKDYAAALPIYERLVQSKSGRQEETLFRLGVTAKAAGDLDRATAAFMHVFYDFPLSESAPFAAGQLASLPNVPAIAPGSDRYKLELTRAERLFTAKQYAPARTTFTALKPMARGDDKELIDLRIAESNALLKHARDARDGLRPYLTGATRQAEVLYYQALVLRDLGLIPDYVTTSHRVVDEFPATSWAQEALNTLATYYIVHDADDKADEVLRELLGTYPKGPYTERAAWKVGWRAYIEGRYDETAAIFERAASNFPRSDYRPPWLYWSGRAHELLSERALAAERFSLVTADYLNSYYGRLAAKRLSGRTPAPRVIANGANGADGVQPQAGAASPTLEQAALIRALISAGLHSHATSELRYAQRTTGDSPAIEATLAWSSYQQGLVETGQTRFTMLRGAITTMRRAYPQFMAAGGEQLPREIQSLIFPVEYWDLIQKYSAVQQLDPYLVAALVAQESTFTADVRSSANAYGLMQLVPATARQQARKLKLTYSSRLLTSPEANIRMGTLYFAEKIQEFGGDIHLALASYNAGEIPVHRWVSDRPTLDVEEFIDDIPYPETQNYVKRILGTAEDYRRLYSK